MADRPEDRDKPYDRRTGRARAYTLSDPRERSPLPGDLRNVPAREPRTPLGMGNTADEYRREFQSTSAYENRSRTDGRVSELPLHQSLVHDVQRGRAGSFTNNRGGPDHSSGSRGDAPMPPEILSALPDKVQIPKAGREVGLKTPYPQGTVGRKVMFKVNHFSIETLPIIQIWVYQFRMQIPESSRRGSAVVSTGHMTKALPQLMDLCPNIVFDGSFTLGWSVTEIIPAGAERKTMINLEDHTEARPNQLEVAIRNGGTLNIKKLAQYHQQGQKAKIDSQLQWLNAVFREDPATRFFCKPKGTTYFTRAPGLTMSLQSTGHVLEAIRGIHQSVSTAFGKLSLNVDVACTAFWVQDKPLIDILKAFAGISPQQNFRILDQVTLADALRRLGESGIVFNVKHLNKTANQKQKKITRITADGARTTTFDLKQAGDVHGAQKSTTTSVFDYYREKYQMTLAYPDLPLLVTRDGFFPIELAFAAAGQRYKDVLEGAVTADFIKFATSPAFVREQQTMENVRRLNWSGLAKPATQGLSVSTRLMEIPGRILPAPIPVYGKGTDSSGQQTGSWNLRGKKLFKPCGFSSWGFMHFGNRISEMQVLSTAKSLAQVLASVGLVTPACPPTIARGNPHGNMREQIHVLFRKAGKPGILFFLLEASPDIYRMIKLICEVELGVPSQVMSEKAFRSQGQVQYFSNIALKVNCKLGGVNCIVKEPLFKTGRWMMLGGDSSHPSPQDLRKAAPPPSFCALVASHDEACVSYTAVATAQNSTVELMQTTGPMFGILMGRYRKQNKGLLPETIVYWRDGIGDSEVNAFLTTEVAALKDYRKEHDLSFKLIVISAVKRTHTRLFPFKKEDGDRKLGNVGVGSIVEAAPQSMFLVSHAALQGTVRPCRYTVLLNERSDSFSVDDFERLAMNATFSYGRATRSVSIHPAIYYADQVAERARMHLNTVDGETVLKDVHENLALTMYWQ